MTPLGLDEASYGASAGASVHEVGHVVAATAPVARPAREIGIAVELTRVPLLAPLVAFMAWQFRREAALAGDTGRESPPLVLCCPR